MQLTRRVTLGLAACGLAGATFAISQPARNVSPGRHPNIAAAQRLTQQAYNRVVQAQQANEFDMGGHAQRAKDLLDQANNELRQAATEANQR